MMVLEERYPGAMYDAMYSRSGVSKDLVRKYDLEREIESRVKAKKHKKKSKKSDKTMIASNAFYSAWYKKGAFNAEVYNPFHRNKSGKGFDKAKLKLSDHSLSISITLNY